MRLSTGRAGRAALAIGLLMLIGGGVAYATIPSSDGTISGCYDEGQGKLRLIDADSGEQCKKKETSISWKTAARLVCPTGTTLSTGVCIEDTSRSPALQSPAAHVCALDGRRLPSGGELRTFRRAPGITLSPLGEWTDDIADTNAGTTGFTIFIVTDAATATTDSFNSLAYRCVAGAGIG